MGDTEELELEFVAQAEDPPGTKAPDAPPAPAAEEEAAAADDFSTEIPETDAAEGESLGQPYTHRGVRLVVRSAEGTKMVNTIEVLSPFELSV